MWRLMLMGVPGVGKGTQAKILSKVLHVPQISTGDILRDIIASDSPMAALVAPKVEKGELVPDSTMIELVRNRLQHDDCRNGYVLDGFPRTLQQAHDLNRNGVHFDHVLKFELPDNEALKRIDGRRIHEPSGRSYHVIFNPPREAGKDDVTGEPLVRRKDDNIETAKQRLATHHARTNPVIEYYQKLAELDGKNAPKFHIINATGDKKEISALVFEAIGYEGQLCTVEKCLRP